MFTGLTENWNGFCCQLRISRLPESFATLRLKNVDACPMSMRHFKTRTKHNKQVMHVHDTILCTQNIFMARISVFVMLIVSACTVWIKCCIKFSLSANIDWWITFGAIIFYTNGQQCNFQQQDCSCDEKSDTCVFNWACSFNQHWIEGRGRCFFNFCNPI